MAGARLLPRSPLSPAGPQVQLFGRRDSRATQRALRYFSERRVPVTFVDLARKSMAAAELRRFAQRFGASALIDKDSQRYRELGLAYLSMGEDEAFDKALADQRLLRLPLARSGDRLSVGVDETAWRDLLGAAGAKGS